MAALPALATVDDLGKLLQVSIEDTDVARAEALLDDASGLIRAEAGTSWVGDDGVTVTAPAVVVTICKNMAKRAFVNPAGYSSETVGNWTGRFADRDQVSSGVYLTEPEIRMIRRAAGAPTLGTITLSRYPSIPLSDSFGNPLGVVSDNFVDVTPPGKPLPVDFPEL